MRCYQQSVIDVLGGRVIRCSSAGAPLAAGAEAKSGGDVEVGLNERFTSAASKLDVDPALLGPSPFEKAPTHVACPSSCLI